MGIFFFFTFFVHFFSEILMFKITLISLTFYFSFLSSILYQETRKSTSFLILVLILLLLLVVLIFFDFNNHGPYSFAFANACLFLLGLYYFYFIFKIDVRLDLLKDPLFVMCCGIFLGTGMIIPFQIMHKYLFHFKVPRDTMFFYIALSSLGTLIMNLIFLRALRLVK